MKESFLCLVDSANFYSQGCNSFHDACSINLVYHILEADGPPAAEICFVDTPFTKDEIIFKLRRLPTKTRPRQTDVSELESSGPKSSITSTDTEYLHESRKNTKNLEDNTGIRFVTQSDCSPSWFVYSFLPFVGESGLVVSCRFLSSLGSSSLSI